MKTLEQIVEKILFSTRWVQALLYLILTAAEVAFVFYCIREAIPFFKAVFSLHVHLAEEQMVTLVVGLVDLVMIGQLIRVVAFGGYITFVSRIKLEGHEDAPDWIAHTNADMLKYQLAGSLVGISSVHLLKSFVEIQSKDPQRVLLQLGIHAIFLLSAFVLWKIAQKSHREH